MNKAERQSSNNLFLDIYRWRKPLVLFTIIAVVAGAIGSSSIFITPKFKSTAVIFPTTTNSVSQALLVEHNPYRKDFLEFGEELEAERLMQILRSDEMRNRIITEFDLFNHYEIKPESKYAQTYMTLAFQEHFSFKRTEYMSINIEVLDRNPELAAQMANRVVDLIDVVIKNIKSERSEQAKKVFDKRAAVIAERLESIQDSLENISNDGVIDVSRQVERLTEYYAKAIASGNTSGAKALKNELDVLALHGTEFRKLIFQKAEIQEQLEFLRRERENIQVDSEALLSNRFVINRAYSSDKKSYPIRWLIVVLSGMAAFMMTLVVLYIRQTIESFESN